MEKNIGRLTYDSSFSRNKLSSKIYDLIGHEYNVGLHSIGFTSKNKREVASQIVENGLNIFNNLSIYSTVRFFGQLYGNDEDLNKYAYDQQDANEVVMIIAIPEKFTHSSGQVIEGGHFPKITVGEAKRRLHEFHFNMNESDRIFKPIPSEMILGCYTFNRKDIKYESKTLQRSVTLPDGRASVVYEIDPYYKAILGPCDFYKNPRHYSQLSQEEKDLFIETHFGNKISKTNSEEQKFYVKRRTFPGINYKRM